MSPYVRLLGRFTGLASLGYARAVGPLVSFLLLTGMGSHCYAQNATKAQATTNVRNTITSNGRNGITGAILQTDLLQMISISASWQQAWSSATQYSFGEIVTYNGAFWIANTPATGVAPGATSGQWTLFAADASSIDVGTTAINNGTSGYLLYVNGGVLGNLLTLPAANFPALTGDLSTSAGSLTTTLATVNSSPGTFGSSTAIPTVTINGKGLVTAASTNAVIAPAGTLTGTTLASNVVNSSLTSVGTIATGTWQATPVGIAYGGFGANNSASSGVPLFASGVITFTSTTGTGNFVRATSPSIAGLTVTGSFTATGLVTNGDLANSTISGISLGSNLDALTISSPLTGTSYNGGSAVTIACPTCVSGTGGALTLPQTVAGTVNSGGIPYFASATSMASSAALAANDIVLGGGAGVAPATDSNASLSAGALSLGASGTAGSVKMGNATSGTVTIQPATGALGSATVSIPGATDTVDLIATAQTLTNKTISGASNTLSNIALGSLASQSANTVVGALTATTPSALTLPSCSGGSNALIWTSGTGFGCNTITASGLSFPVTVAGTVNSGGVPYFASTTSMASSSAGTANDVMAWGGAGSAPIDTSIAYTNINQTTGSATINHIATYSGTGKNTQDSGVNISALTTMPTISLVSVSSHSGGFSASGSGTYTTPAGVTWIEIKLVGGGGGGSSGNSPSGGNGGAGGTTSFGTSLLTANGGAGGVLNGAGAPSGGTTSISSPAVGLYNLQGGNGSDSSGLASADGPPGCTSPLGGGGLVAGLTQAGLAAGPFTGSGGGASSTSTGGNAGSSGACGGYIDAIIVSPLATYAYSVGSGGAGGTAGSGGFLGGAGGSGQILVVEHYGS